MVSRKDGSIVKVLGLLIFMARTVKQMFIGSKKKALENINLRLKSGWIEVI